VDWHQGAIVPEASGLLKALCAVPSLSSVIAIINRVGDVACHAEDLVSALDSFHVVQPSW